MALVKPKVQEIPNNLKPFVRFGFDYDETKLTPTGYYGSCLFCGKYDHMYISADTGMWRCVKCNFHGNKYTFIQMMYDLWLEEREEGKQDKELQDLAKDRKLPVEALTEAGIVYSGEDFVIPVFNIQGKLVNFRTYDLYGPIPRGKKKHLLMGVATFPAQLYGVEVLAEKGRLKEIIYIVEGEWDTIALRWLLKQEGRSGIVLGVPGADSWKSEWSEYVDNRHIVICLDQGTAGQRGTENIYRRNFDKANLIEYINWPVDLPDGYDVRDHVTNDLTMADMDKMIEVYVCQADRDKEHLRVAKKRELTDKTRPTWFDVKSVFTKYLHMSDDLWNALRIVFATVITTQIPDDPLWMHIVGPAGCGKTSIVMSAAGCSDVIARSTLSPNMLVSGFQGTNDPSLLAILNGKCLFVKDATEILTMSRDDKVTVFSTLRGAYDGTVARTYGNGVRREYKVHCNIVFAVTGAIYGEPSASLGSRFLMYHIKKTRETKNVNSRAAARMAIRSVGKGTQINHELNDIVTKFLDVVVTPEDYPLLPESMEDRIIGLGEVLAILRAEVDRDERRDRKLKFRPESEEATRICKQLTKLAMGLALIDDVSEVNEDHLKIITRVALDSCVGFNLEAITSLIEKPGQTITELCESCNLPRTTMQDQVEDLYELGALKISKAKLNGPGRRPHTYYVTEMLKDMWEMAGLIKKVEEVNSIQRTRKRFNIRVKQRRLV